MKKKKTEDIVVVLCYRVSTWFCDTPVLQPDNTSTDEQVRYVHRTDVTCTCHIVSVFIPDSAADEL